jgi:hypothetical protein
MNTDIGYVSSLQYADMIAADMKKNLKGIKGFSINSRVVNNILNQYFVYVKLYGPPVPESRDGVAVKWSPAAYRFAGKLVDILKLPKLLILNFFLSLRDLASAGKIEYKLFDPGAVAKGQKAKKAIMPPIVPEGVGQEIGKAIRNVAIVSVALAAVYLTFKFKR